jgi:peptidoglycan/LPS O-acetylase OafA/YrhL
MTESTASAHAGQSLAPPYRRDIDGLRAVAVLSVAFYHARLPGFGGGFVGVDVFFVISGFLITQIVAREIERERFSLLGFYERRVRRIFPALFAMQLVTLAVGFWVLLPDDLVQLAKSAVATTFFSANFLFFSESGYFDAPSWTKPLLHTWSLAVEEQFYIVFPALLLLAKRKLGGRYLAPTLATVALSFALCVAGTHNFRDADFYLAPTRAWELGLGCLLALGALPALRAPVLREVAAALGLALIAYAVVSYSDDTKFPGVNTLPPCLGALLLLWAGCDGPSAVGRMLSTGPAVFFGLISYSLYLWHWPLLVYAGYVLARPLRVVEASALLALATAVSAASWRWIERPFRGAASRVSGRAVFRAAVAVSLATTAAGLAIAVTGGRPGRLDAVGAQLAATRAEKDAMRVWCERSKVGGGRTTTWVKSLGDPNAAQASFIVWGDSHACMLSEAIGELARSHGRRGYLAWGGGCPPLLVDPDAIAPNECTEANERVAAALGADAGLTDVVMIGRWALYFAGHGYGEERIRAPLDPIERDGSVPRAYVFSAALQHTAVSLAGQGHRVWVFGPVPEVNADVPSVLARARMIGRAVDPSPTLAEFLERQRDVLPALERLRATPGVHVLRPDERLCRDARCDVLRDGQALYYDHNHLSRAGASQVIDLFEPIFAER